MATIVAAAAGGNWSAGATWVGGVAPTAADDAVLNATSGNVTIDTAATCVCRSLNCTGYTGTLTHAASRTLTIGHSTPGASNIALKLVPGMTYVPANGTSSVIAFASTSATQQTIDSGGKTLGRTNIAGVGSSYILVAAMTWRSDAFFALSAGTFNSGNFAMSGGSMSSSGSTARTMTLGSSTITLSGTTSSAFSISGSNMTLNAGTSNFVMTGVNAGFLGNGMTFHTLTLAATSGQQVVHSANTFTNLIFSTPAFAGSSKLISANQTVTGTFTVNGTSSLRQLVATSNGAGTRTVGTPLTITAANVSTTFTDFSDITAAGAASWDLSAADSGDALGNTGITFSAPQTNYAVGVVGTTDVWNDPTKWATSSGGVAGTGRVPLPQDNAVIDGNSGSGTIFSVNVQRVAKDVTWNNAAMTMNVSGQLPNLYGSLNIVAALSITGGLTWSFIARSGSHTIGTAGLSKPGSYVINAPGATYTLTSDLVVSSVFQLTAGAFDTDDFDMTAAQFTFTGTAVRSATLGTSTMNMTGTAGTDWNIGTPTNFTLSAEDSTLRVPIATPTGDYTIDGGNFDYGTIDYTVAGSAAAMLLVNIGSVKTLNFSDANNERTLYVFSGTLDILEAFNVFGTAGKAMIVRGVSGGGEEVVNYLGEGVVSSDWLVIKDLDATPADTWYAGPNSYSDTGLGSYDGWIFANPPGGTKNPVMIV